MQAMLADLDAVDEHIARMRRAGIGVEELEERSRMLRDTLSGVVREFMPEARG